MPCTPVRMRRLLVVLVTLITLQGCAGSAGDDDDMPLQEQAAEEALTSGWTSVGAGVAYKHVGDGDAVWIGYGGYSVQTDWAIAWSEELHRTRLRALGVGHLYAVKGPNDPGYRNREVANTALGAHLLTGPGPEAPFVLVAAHSSGTYVAHELFGQLEDRGAATATLRKKIVYANLDGGGSGLDRALVSSFKRAAFVWAEDPRLGSGRSANASSMTSLASTFGTSATRIEGSGSGCHSGAKWCLHDLVITTRPHNPATFDLRRDYTDFASRPVQTAWIDALAPSLR